MESSHRFKRQFLKILQEDMVTGAAGMSSTGYSPENGIESSDFYSPGDARVPKSVFSGVMTRSGLKKKRKKRKTRKPRKKRKSRKIKK